MAALDKATAAAVTKTRVHKSAQARRRESWQRCRWSSSERSEEKRSTTRRREEVGEKLEGLLLVQRDLEQQLHQCGVGWELLKI